ncbi:MAG: peptidoglycan-binding protein [Candidatus Peregrinibacteria bacterium]
MKIQHTPLYHRVQRKFPWHIQVIILCLSVIAPLMVLGETPDGPYQQDFILTAYYSPLPGQCCYVRGGYVADKILNGEGVHGADGTDVYPGMIAAPKSYAFGTMVALPGLGRFTVHDRGGAIQELDNGAHRLDVWAGYGEEGLARALAFGVRKIRGTVYPVGHRQPKESFTFEALPASLDRLETFSVSGDDLLSVQPKAGDRGLSVDLLQRSLKDVGFFAGSSTGFFGQETTDALTAFNTAYRLKESSVQLTERSAATLTAALRRLPAVFPVAQNVDIDAAPKAVTAAQRMLRYLGFYSGRTNGMYDLLLSDAILRFQKAKGLVADALSPGAGTIGPITRGKMQEAWNRRLVTAMADRYVMLHRVQIALDQKKGMVDRFVDLGESGDTVTLLQHMLADRGFFPEDKINGNFGDFTKSALIEYQLDRKIITSKKNDGAGSVGPQTLLSLRSEERQKLYEVVRSQGWRAL